MNLPLLVKNCLNELAEIAGKSQEILEKNKENLKKKESNTTRSASCITITEGKVIWRFFFFIFFLSGQQQKCLERCKRFPRRRELNFSTNQRHRTKKAKSLFSRVFSPCADFFYFFALFHFLFFSVFLFFYFFYFSLSVYFCRFSLYVERSLFFFFGAVRVNGDLVVARVHTEDKH